ncbi:hypothetical protein BN1708_020733, partial [Verticillium longisporum]
QYECSFCG